MGKFAGLSDHIPAKPQLMTLYEIYFAIIQMVVKTSIEA
jgi:hypothetical protein